MSRPNDCDDSKPPDEKSDGFMNGDLLATKKVKPIPPPLDLSVRNLELVDGHIEHDRDSFSVSPKSPNLQKHLPLRKRAFSWSNLQTASTSQCEDYGSLSIVFPAPSKCDISPKPSCQSSSSASAKSEVPFRAPQLNDAKSLKFSIASLGLEGLLTPTSSSSSQLSASGSAETLSDSTSPIPSSLVSPPPLLPLNLSQDSLWSPGVCSPVFKPVWGCFQAGTKLRLSGGDDTQWIPVEKLASSTTAYLVPFLPPPSSPLQVSKIERVATGSELTFSLIQFRLLDSSKVLIAACPTEHPFLVQEKGWSSVFPDLTVSKYGMPCRELKVGELCIPPGYAEAHTSLTPDFCANFQVFTFPPSVSTMSPINLAFGRGNPFLSPPPIRGSFPIPSPPSSPSFVSSPSSRSAGALPISMAYDPDRPRRPMNGFMLFAKHFRQEMIQTNPGKDNRSISILLGEAWKNLDATQREDYSQRARQIADEYKRVHPDCWKRRRTKVKQVNHVSMPSNNL